MEKGGMGKSCFYAQYFVYVIFTSYFRGNKMFYI